MVFPILREVHPDRKFPERKLAAMDENGVADLAVGGQVGDHHPADRAGAVRRHPGTPAEARASRFYADDAAPAVAALWAGDPVAGPNRTGDTPGSAAVGHACDERPPTASPGSAAWIAPPGSPLSTRPRR